MHFRKLFGLQPKSKMNKTFVGHKLQLLDSKATGIAICLSSLSSDNMKPKYSVSFDKENRIERIKGDKIQFGQKVSDSDFFDRLIRSVHSDDEKTREFASEILCDFLEFEIASFDLNNLKIGVEKIVKRLRVEKNINVQQKLTEGLFEFIWSNKLPKSDEVILLERLTEIDSYHICQYLDGSDYMQIQKVQEYVERNKNSS